MRNQSGQVLVLLIVIITVALATGLSIIQKSISDVSTASKVEQSSRAFSAAEAGIEKALKGDSGGVNFSANNSQATVADQGLQPVTASVNTTQDSLEYPALAKEDVAQVWFADPDSSGNPPSEFYKQRQLDVYWGNSAADKAAIELTIVYYSPQSKYQTAQWFLDNASATRNPSNGFTPVSCSGNNPVGINKYQCKQTVNFNDKIPAGGLLMLMRVKLLYNTTSQPFAVKAVGTCGTACSLPPQARIVYSTGISGETQRRVRIFQEKKVVPFYFDYALFSAGDITK